MGAGYIQRHSLGKYWILRNVRTYENVMFSPELSPVPVISVVTSYIYIPHIYGLCCAVQFLSVLFPEPRFPFPEPARSALISKARLLTVIPAFNCVESQPRTLRRYAAARTRSDQLSERVETRSLNLSTTSDDSNF